MCCTQPYDVAPVLACVAMLCNEHSDGHLNNILILNMLHFLVSLVPMGWISPTNQDIFKCLICAIVLAVVRWIL